MKEYNIAIVGATGAVGTAMLEVLKEYDLPINKLKLIASPRSEGKKIQYNKDTYIVQKVEKGIFEDIDIALFSIGSSNSKKFIPQAVYEGALIIDNSNAYRMDKEVPLIVPEINPEKIKKHNGIIANPNCSTIQMVVAINSLQKAKKIALRMADSNSTVLITGDTGTGKELFAQAIHNESKRKDNQFVAINCAALPESLLESELFGYEKGAFTGAKKEGKMGLFELAHHGTLFLDEISEMPLKLQSRLLRVLEQRKVMRIGGDSVINIDVRIIAATNRVLKDLVNRGEFRKDLFYRLSVLPLKIPSLNEREKDVILLIKKFKSDLNADYKLSEEVIELFLSHEWQGNVRELRNYLEFFANLNKGDIGIEDLPFTFDESRKVKYNLSEQDKDILNSLHSQIAPPKLDNYIFVLSELDKRFKNNQSTGRRSITKAAKKQEIYITEQDIRNIYQRLDKLGLVKIKKGRGGTRITKRGKRIVDFLIKNNN